MQHFGFSYAAFNSKVAKWQSGKGAEWQRQSLKAKAKLKSKGKEKA